MVELVSAYSVKITPLQLVLKDDWIVEISKVACHASIVVPKEAIILLVLQVSVVGVLCLEVSLSGLVHRWPPHVQSKIVRHSFD